MKPAIGAVIQNSYGAKFEVFEVDDSHAYLKIIQMTDAFAAHIEKMHGYPVYDTELGNFQTVKLTFDKFGEYVNRGKIKEALGL